jgi:cardiolipin synthase
MLGGLELMWVVALALGLVLERRSPVATLAWILALVWLPAVGIIVYLFFGPRRLARKKRKRAASKSQLRAAIDLVDAETDDLSRTQLAQLGVSAGEAPPLPAHGVELFTEGDVCFASMLRAIAGARHHVHLEYYIWQPDRIGMRLRDALVERAQAGVEVRLLLDGIGAFSINNRFVAPLRAAGATIEWFNPVNPLRGRFRRADFRTHRKILVVDGNIGFTGGINVDECHGAEFREGRAWRDTHLRFEGTAVLALQRLFLEDWAFASERDAPVGLPYLPRPHVVDVNGGDHLVQVVGSGPDTDVFAIHKLYFSAITSAKKRVWITTPYFVPDEPILEAISTAAMRRVDVRIIVPRAGDSRLVTFAARSYFPELLRAGARIFEYEGRFIHAKTMVVDDDLAIVGTANLDNRSFRLNFEVIAAVYGTDLAARLADAFEADLACTREVQPKVLQREPLLLRLGESAARLMSPLL